MSIANNIRYLRKKHNYSQDKLAELLNYKSFTTIQKWESGVSEPPLKICVRLADLFNVDVDELVGTDLTVNKHDYDITNIKNIDSIFPITVKKFPLLGEIACGEPILANEDRESYILSGTDIDADFCLKAKGDSMIGARIHDGDIVFIKKADVVNNGEVAAVIIDDEVLLKRFYYFKDENLLTLQSENPKYPPKNYVNEQLDHIRVIGKAIAFQSDVR